MIRLPDWEMRLAAYLESSSAARFGYGHQRDPWQHDCCSFAGGNVIALTGEDAMAEFRGRYSTARGAWRALRRYGAGTIAQTLTAKFPVAARAFARRGDLVMADGTVGVCIGGDAVFIGAEGAREGLVRVARSGWADLIWQVG